MKYFYITLLISILITLSAKSQDTYYSQGSANFTVVGSWNTAANGSGTNPSGLSDFQDGTNTFIIQDSHTMTVNDSINCAGITVGGGTSGVLTLGNDATSRYLIIGGVFTVDANAVVNVGAFAATHKIYLGGDLTNDGAITLRNSSSQVANLFLDGASDINGTGTETFNNVEQISTTQSFTATKALNIDGSLIVNSSTTFNAGAFTHTIAGNFTNSGTFSASTGTIVLDATLVQSITDAATFNNLEIKGGGVTVLSGRIIVNGNVSITESTTVKTDDRHRFNGDFTVADGSEFKATNERVEFYGSSAQSINIGTSNSLFYNVYFSNAGIKTIYGNLIVDNYTEILSTATVYDDGDAWSHAFDNGMSLEGLFEVTGDITLKGGTYDKGPNDSTDGFYMGVGSDIFIEGGVTVRGGDTMYVSGDITINSGYIVLASRDRSSSVGDTVSAVLSGLPAKTLAVNAASRLYMRGWDNFPSGFGSVDLQLGSLAIYDANFNQTIRGDLTYGYLYLYNWDKTADNPIIVLNNLGIYAPANDTIHFNMGSNNLSVGGNVNDNYNASRPNQKCYLTCDADFNLNGEDVNQYVYARTAGIYKFNNFYVTNPNPTAIRTKRIYGDITVTNDFSVVNSTDNELLYLIFDIDDGIINGGNEFILGSNVNFRTNREDNSPSAGSFITISFDVNSTIRFDGTAQTIPGGITYGHIELYGDGIKTMDGNLDINGDLTDVGYTPVLTSSTTNMVINIAGDWSLENNNINLDESCSVLFDGADQIISSTTVPNIILKGSGVKDLEGTLIIEGDLVISNGVEFDADNRYISIHGNWDNSSNGTFHQVAGRTAFIGDDGQNISIQSTVNSRFYDITIDKPLGDTVFLSTDVAIDRNFRFTQDNGNLHLNDKTLSIGGDWYIYTNCELLYDTGGKLVFNGSSTEQLLRNYNASTIYPDMEFSGSSLKRLYDNPFDVNGDFYINNSTVGGEWIYLSISGDWKNSGGTFNHYRSVTFDGANQLIDGTTFDDIVFSGTGTKKLNGNISLTGWLRIDSTATLDVSPDAGVNDYDITIEEHWYNDEWSVDSSSTGAFTPRTGKVKFIGGNSNIYTGDSIDASGVGRAGKQFYNLTINNNDNNNYTRLYPVHTGAVKDAGNDVRVLNDLTINSGIFYTYWNKVYVGGNLLNVGGYFNMNEYYTQNSTLTLEGTTGILSFNPGETQYFRKVVVDGGATYRLADDLEILGNAGDNGDLNIIDGTLDLNHNNLTMTSAIGDVIIHTDGKLALDSAAILSMPTGRWLRNVGGEIELLGNVSTPARVTSTGNFYFIQESGKIGAKYFVIENTLDSGLNVRGGTIDAINDLSYGSFSGGAGNSYLTIDGIDLGAGITATDVQFTETSTGVPQYNVQRLTGSGVMTLQDAIGTFAGSTYENDGGALIEWAYVGGIKEWDGGAGDNLWSSANNWFPDGVPDASTNVYLNKVRNGGGNYTITISSGAEVNNLVFDVSGVGVTLNGDSLTVNGDLTIKSGATLTQTSTTDTLRLRGNWFNSGNYVCNTGPVVYDLLSDTYNVSNTDDIYQLFITGQEGILYLSSHLYITDSIVFNGATLSSTNKDIYVSGSWTMDGGVFDAGTGDVIFDKDDNSVNQLIKGGDFYNLIARNLSTKEISSNISVSNNFDIESGANVDGKTSYLFIGRRWRNSAGETGFDQTGSGTVVFNRLGTSYIGTHDATTNKTVFNNIIIQGTGTKYVGDSIKIKGNLTNQNGTNLYLYSDVAIDGIGASNSFSVTGGTIYLLGENNFPENFETIDLSGGTIRYQSDTLQYIYPTKYYNLRLERQHVDSLNKKVLTSDIEVQYAITIADVETLFDVNDFTITLHNYISLPTGGRQIDWGTGELIHVGGDWRIDVDITEFNDFTKKGDGWITIYDDITVTGNVVFYDETYLNMQSYALDCSVADKNFTMGSGTRLYSYRAGINGKAFPQGFAAYSLDITNLTFIRGNEDQEIFTGVEYGIMYLYDNSSKTVEINADLTVRDDFYMSYDGIELIDNGNDIYIGGDYIDFRNYTPTNTIYLNGDKDQRIRATGAYTTLTLNNIELSGTGQKNLDEATIDINGKIKINSGVTFYSNDNIFFSGDSLINEGTLSHTANLFSFDGVNQIINPGVTNDFYGVSFTGSGIDNIITNGIDVNNGLFSIGDGVTLNLGSLTHNIASTTIDFSGTGSWVETNASIYFDRNGTQYIPALSLNNIYFSTGGYKYLRGNISVNDLIIGNGVRLRTTETTSSAYDITLTGNWLNEGYFYAYDGTVLFESSDVAAKTITTNNNNFNVVKFNQTNISSRSYSLVDNMTFVDSMAIGDGATLHLNGYNLTVGNNDPNNTTPPYVPDGEILDVESGGSLIVDGGASLQFNLYDGNPKLNVYGILEVVGDVGLNANITRSVGYNTRGIEITIFSGGEVKAKNYHMQYLAFNGLLVKDGATIDNTNNFSNGIWSNIYPGTQYTDPQDQATVIDTFIYLNIEIDAVGALANIENVTFNHSSSPVVDRHFNVRRVGTATDKVTFDGTINGLMAGETYEMDPSDMIDWPPVTQLTWTGNVSTDWFDLNNWDGLLVPTKTHNVVIPLVSNNPLIYKQGSKCANLDITNGILSIETGVDSLVVSGNVQIGSNGILAIEDNAEIKVSGDWNVATDGTFMEGNSLVRFVSPIGSVVIEQHGSRFNNLTFEGDASFFLEGRENTVNGDFTLISGQFIPNDNNYTLTIKGDYLHSGGDFSKSPNVGFVNFAGTDQTITDGDFSRVEFSNSGTKTIVNSLATSYASNTYTNNTFIISESATVASAGCTFTLKGNVYIDALATFNDGGESHTFTGRYWTGLGAYVGAGTITFNGRTQSIYESKFSNLIITEEVGRNDYKYLLDDVTLTGNLTVDAYSVNCDTYTFTSTGAGVFTQNAGSRLYIRGVNNYPTGFSTYNADATSYTFYDGAIDQTIRESVYGRLRLDGTNTKTLEGAITIKDELYFYDRSVILDANNQTINIGGNWNNNYSGTFIPGTGDVVFDGASNNQNISLGSSVDNEFYKLTVDKDDPSYYVRIAGRNNVVKNDILVHSGIYYTDNGYTTYIGGNMIAQNDGTFRRSGTYEINNTSGTSVLQVNGSILNNLTINSGGICQLATGDVLDVMGVFTVKSGIFDGNSNDVYLGNYLDVVNIEGEYYVGAGGNLYLGSQTTFAVKSGGVFKIVGDASNISMVKGRTGTYYFNIESGAEIHAQHYVFKDMRSAGIKVASGATIDATNNFSNGTFSNPTNGGTCLNIENNQELSGVGNRIENVSFPENPGYGTVNVRKDESTAGVLEFYNATGLLSGAEYESDPYNLIEWTGDVTLTWTGAISDDWFNSSNWSASSGADIIPNENNTVIIPSGTTNFPIVDADSAKAKSLTIESGATMSIDNSTATGRSLIVTSDILVNGTLNMTNASDTLEVTGNWGRGSNGSFVSGLGSVVFNGIGAISLNNRASSFYNLFINVNGAVDLLYDLNVSHDFIIQNGAFDVTSSDNELKVGGDFLVSGTFTAQSGKVVLESTGSQNIDIGGSSFYDLELKNGTYTMINNDLQINRNFDLTGGTLIVTELTLYMGDDSGYDDMSISGMLDINDDGKLEVGSNTSINIYSGGELSLIGLNNHEAIITNRTSGRYSLIVNSGGTMTADFYKIEYIDATGLWFKPGSLLDKTTNNLSNGAFSYGASGGRYILFENGYASDNDTVKILNVYFNSGASYSAKRDDASTLGIINFKDGLGVVAGYYFEDDDGSSTTGSIVWSYTDPILYWVGNNTSGGDTEGNRWDNPNNWEDEGGSPGVPTSSTQVFVNTVSHGKYPVLNAGTDNDAKHINIYSGASMTLGGNINLDVTSDLIIAGTLTVENGSVSTIEVGGQYANSGSFVHGGASTLLWTTVDNNSINTSGSPFYNLTFDSGSGAGTAIFSTESSIEIDGDFTILKGTVNVSDDAHNFTISGDFDNQDAFNNGDNTFIFNGNSAQSIASVTDLTFGDIEFSGGGTKTLGVNIVINDDLTLNSTLNVTDKTIQIKGDWEGSGTFNSGTGTVTFNGAISQRISKAELFNNLIINNSATINPISLNGSVSVDGQLDLTDGIVITTPSKLVVLNSGSTLGNYSATAYVNGPMKRVGSTSFKFPIGSSAYYAPLEVSDFSGSNTFTAQYFEAAPSNRLLLETGLNKVSETEYWNLSRSSGTGTPKVTLHWTDRSHSGITDVEVLSVAYYNSGASEWKNYDTLEVVPSVDTSMGYVTSGNNFSMFGDITFGFAYPTLIWTGTVSSDWTDVDNWTGTGTPNSQTNVTIPDVGAGNRPVLSSNSQETYNLTVEAGGHLVISDNIELNTYGVTTITDSLVLGLSSTLVIYQDLTQTGELISGIGSSLKFAGTDDQVIDIDTCYNLILNGSGDKILGSNIVVLGSVNILNTLLAGVNNINVFGNWSNSGSFNSGTGTVIFKGSSSQSISEPSSNGFNDVVINNSSAVIPQITLGSHVIISGDLSLTDGVIQSSSAHLLNFEENATVSLCSDSSHINGLVKRNGVNDFVFPLGENSILGQIGISDMSGSGYFEAEYFEGESEHFNNNREAGIVSVSNIEYWDLFRSSGTATPLVTLHWADSSRSGIGDHTQLIVAHHHNSQWNNTGNSNSNVHIDSSGFVTSTDHFNSFSHITHGSLHEDNPLPIELTSFTAHVVDNHVKLNWETASENNSSHFEIERSLDGKTVEIIGEISAAGNSSLPIQYNFTDKNPLIGTSYYRLVQTDNNGDSHTYKWESVIYNRNNAMSEPFMLELYPNPGLQSEIIVELTMENPGEFDIEIYSVIGERIFIKSINIEERSQVYEIQFDELTELPQGIYLLNVVGNNHRKQLRFVIK